MSVFSILLCGGSGTRMGLAGNKTLIPVGGIPGCVRAFRTLRKFSDGIVIVTRESEIKLFTELFQNEAPYAIVAGGEDRQASVKNGLDALPDDCDIVLVHDGARPLVDDKTVQSVLDSVKKYGSGIASTKMRDTVKHADPDGTILDTPDRNSLYAVQTPQGFLTKILKDAHERVKERMTDDAALCEKAGYTVHLSEGSYTNIKLTSQEDILTAQAYASGICPRIGQGYDAHRLVEGRKLILCGVDIPYEKGLLGHSDADVALHALCDSLLGAAGLGDIGQHFPDTDNAYFGISSLILLEKTREILEKHGFFVYNVDVTVIAQRPKLLPYIGQMKENVARALNIDVSFVSVKATTTEKMGFEGRGEGISAMSVATVLQHPAL